MSIGCAWGTTNIALRHSATEGGDLDAECIIGAKVPGERPAAIYGRCCGCVGWGVRACAQLRARTATYRVLVLAARISTRVQSMGRFLRL